MDFSFFTFTKVCLCNILKKIIKQLSLSKLFNKESIMVKNLCTVLLLLFAISSIYANNKELLANDIKKWIGKVELSPKHSKENSPCFVLYGRYPTKLIYKDFFPIDKNKSYSFKARLRTLDEKLPASAYMGFEVLDAKKRQITYQNVVTVPLNYSEVILAKKGSKEVIIKLIPNFEKIVKQKLAFNAKEDKSDIPNFDLSPRCKKVTKIDDNTIKIELIQPLTKDYPAGTKIRVHSCYAVPMYYLVSGWMPAGDGKECVAKLDGVANIPGANKLSFWKGTAYARPFIWFGNWNRKPQAGAKLLVDKISLTESSQK